MSGPPVLVVGAPRSGTSLVAQLLSAAGVAFGDRLLPASEANPRGFYEDVDLTDLDDEILAPHVVGRGVLPVPTARLAWVGVPDPAARPGADAGQRARMRALLGPHAGGARRGLKDPRLVWTLDAWRPELAADTALVAVVRRPDEVATSLRSMWARDRPYYGDLELTVARGLRMWTAAGRRLLAHLDEGRWLVVDHADLLSPSPPGRAGGGGGGGGGGAAALAAFTGLPVDAGGVDRALHRSRPAPASLPAGTAEVWDRLRGRARRDAERWSTRAA